MTTDLDLRRRVTQERISRFQRVLERLENRISDGEQNELLAIETAAARSELDRLQRELSSLDDNNSETPDQALQNRGTYEMTLGNAMNIAEDLGIFWEYSAPKWDADWMLPQLAARGMSREFLESRLLVSDADYGVEDPKLNSDLFGATLQRVLGLNEEQAQFYQDNDIMPQTQVQLRAPISANTESTRLYSRYVDYLVQVIGEAMPERKYRDISGLTAENMREQILANYGEVSLWSALHFAWDHGIPVLPLDDPGRFDGALWRHEHGPVIVLNLRDRSESRWLLLLLHELAHATQEADGQSVAILETLDFIRDWNQAEAEHEARWFALDVAFGQRVEQLTERIVNRASNSVPQLKSAIVDVTRVENVDLGILADFLAFQLNKSGVNWWGTATNLQPKDTNPLNLARTVFHKYFDGSTLSAFDSLLIGRAIQGDRSE